MPTLDSCRAGVALVIGVGQYLRADCIEALRFAAHDAIALADALADPGLCAFPRDQVLLLTNGDAGRDQLVQRLSRWLPERARGAELVVIYFAGHGMVQTVGRREEGFLLPYDADPDDVVTRGVAMSDLARWIDGLDARAVVVCLDCCHAGKVLGQRGVGPALAARNLELKPAVLEGMAGRGRYLIASCDEGQKSFECAEVGHGLFTFHLLRGIAGEADRDGDGRVGIAELFNYVAAAVARDAWHRFGREQRPWTSATWAEETYISSPNLHTTASDADPIERLWREHGAAAAVQEVGRLLPGGDEATLRRALRFLGRVKEPAGIPAIFRCLAHAAETVRSEAGFALRSFRWEAVVTAVESLARQGDREATGAVLDGLNAFEAHPTVVSLLDRLIVLLKGEMRSRTILLLERKALGLELDRVAALFQEIHSPYKIERVLGQGLFTATYLARDEGNGLAVVVRVLRPEFASQPHLRARFLDLANHAVRLVHENLALTREVRAFPDQNIYFAVRDYISGVTLRRVQEAGKRFEPNRVIRILRETARALAPLQRVAACHGGIKSSNVFLCDGGRRVVLGDPCPPAQGIGLALDRLAYDYRYAPPETFLGAGALGPRSDFYSLGCLAYELLCGEPPFHSDNFHELASLHLNGTVLPPSRRGSRLGGRGDAVVLKLLARSPAERYGNLEEVIQALDSLQVVPEGPFCGGPPAPPAPAVPLLHDASILNYQGAQSVMSFNQAQAPPLEPAFGVKNPPVEQHASEKRSLESLDPNWGKSGSLGPKFPHLPGYEILNELGRGGMGQVYKARDMRLERMVALKVVHAGWENAEARARFRTEALAIARLQHANIVQIHDLIEHRGLICLALEYVDGGDLLKRLRQDGPMPIADAVSLMVTLARAVEFAHQHGLLHRDLKPSNILLTPDGQPKIADFGLAKKLGESPDAPELTRTGQVMGTPGYMSPEQVYGRVSVASDVYALGTILYEMLTGQRPFAGGPSVADLLERVTSEKPAPPRRLRPEIPHDVEAICLKCLEKQPARRYASAAALADDLERWSRGERVAVKPPSLQQRLLRLLPFRKAVTDPRGGHAPET
jgi:serine/threonine protein kinase